MSYFIPSSIQKRLLRYALSRVELLDTDALDLEHLDVEWGRRSTVELKDVGLRKQKLTTLLDIPQYLKLEHASIGLLRITIPADIHTSAIILEVEGVEARLRLLDKAEDTTPKLDKLPHTTGGSQTNRRPKKEVQFATLRSSLQREGSTLSSDDEEDGLPTTHDLAMSFLAEDHSEEKEQLEAAFVSQSTIDLRQSIVSTASSEEDTPIGTGLGVGLPNFLAAFLKGVGDRLQVQIKKVILKLEVDGDITGNSGSSHITDKGQDHTTIAFFVDGIDVCEVENIPPSPNTVQPDRKNDKNVKSVESTHSTEKRRIVLKNLFASILSENELLSTPSPVYDKKFREGLQPVPNLIPIPRDATGSESTQSSRLMSTTHLDVDHHPFQSENDSKGMKSKLSEDNSESQYFFDAETSETLSTTSLRDLDPSPLPERDIVAPTRNDQLLSELNDAIFEQSIAYTTLSDVESATSPVQESQGSRAGDLYNSLKSFREEMSPSASSSNLRARGRFSRSPSPHKTSNVRLQSNSPSIEALRITPHRSVSFETTSSVSTEIFAQQAHPNDSLTPGLPPVEDSLTESMMFSREEAESIYMSVLDEPQVAFSKHMHIPGAWDDANDADVSSATNIATGTESQTLPLGDGASQNTSMQDLGSSEPLESASLSLDGEMKPQSTETKSGPGRASMDHSIGDPMVGRNFLYVDTAEFWISSSIMSHDKHVPVKDHSKERTLPGSFSLYAESKSSIRGSGFVPRTTLEASTNDDPYVETSKPLQGAAETLYELILHSVRAKTDVSAGRIFMEMFQRIQNASNLNTTELPPRAGRTPDMKPPAGASSTFGLRVNSLMVEFLELLEPRLIEPTTKDSSRHGSLPVSDGLLFILKAQDLEFGSTKTSAAQSKLDIGKLSFGFSDHDIISFSKTAKIRSSMRDLQTPSDKDISMIFGHVKNTTEVNVHTKPLQILLNLQRLDNTFGSVGGLSGLMDLGSSVGSESTIIVPPPRTIRTRSVHFEHSVQSSNQLTVSGKSRFNVRIGGAAVRVEGKNSSIKVQSTAIKLVGRDANLGIQIDDIRLTGPHMYTQTTEPGFNIRLKNTGFKYLTVPEEHDLTRLISLLTPSKDKFEDDDDFLVDTLIRQRRKGSVLRTNIAKLEFKMHNINAIRDVQDLFDEAGKMSTLTKYLPEETRPGLLILGVVDQAVLEAETDHKIGPVSVELKAAEFAHINLPSLVAVSLGKIAVVREDGNPVINEVIPLDVAGQPPMFMARMIGDELEPTVKLKLWNVCFEYSVPLIMALLDIPNDGIQDDGSIDLRASISALIEPRGLANSGTTRSGLSHHSSSNSKQLAINLALRDCAVGLTPRNMSSKALFVVTDGRLCGAPPDKDGFGIMVELRKAGLLIVDDARKLASDTEPPLAHRTPSQAAVSNHIPDLCSLGFVSVSTVSAATVMVKLIRGSQDAEDIWDIEFKDELFVLETCADSTQTLIDTLNDLKPPFPPSKGQKYRTEIAPMQDMMASFTGDAFALGAPEFQERKHLGLENISDEDLAREFDDLSDFADMEPGIHPMLGDKLRGYSSAHLKNLGITGVYDSNVQYMTPGGGKANGAPRSRTLPVGKKWDSSNNRYVTVDSKELSASPVQIRVRDVHIIWNMFDGYDWEKTRDTITKAVQVIEAKAEERRFGRRFDEEEDKESVIGDFLFNSIYIGIPVNQDPQELTRQINRNMDDLVSETASHTSTANSRPSSSHRTPRNQGRKLKLERSKRHKVAFELRGVSADIFAFAPGGETQTSIDLRITDFEIFDHIPTSTWKKFATYMHDAGPRDERKPMVHLEICDVKPVPELTATEMVIRVNVLPVRLHVDQDALDFITRFFDFQDDTKNSSGPPPEQPYLQRVEVRAVPIKLDYKPKTVDYAGLRSGRTTEFVNFFILDGADMVLKHTIVYGTSGFLKLHKSLEDVWMPDIRRNQLPSVLSGLNGVRSLVNMGTGIRDLVVIPVREYKKDGKIVRSISKGALAFAKTTGGELTRFGAKLAIGAQTALQGAEDFFVKPGYHPQSVGYGGGGEPGWESGEIEADERRAISHYANQPTGILQGLKGAARSLERDLLLTKDVIIAVSGEARESGTAEGAARAVARHAPTLILRPMIGASKAISQTLMGATNTVDPQNRRRVEDKYKRY